MPNLPQNYYASSRRLAAILCVVLFGLTLASCDKCGNSIFGSSAGSLVCANKLPQPH